MNVTITRNVPASIYATVNGIRQRADLTVTALVDISQVCGSASATLIRVISASVTADGTPVAWDSLENYDKETVAFYVEGYACEQARRA